MTSHRETIKREVSKVTDAMLDGVHNKELLAEAVAILRECEQKWGCECPYSHADYCRLKRFLDTAQREQ